MAFPTSIAAQDDTPADNTKAAESAEAAESADEPASKSADQSEAAVTYPRAVGLSGDDLFVVDLDLPGIWRVQGDQRELYVRGTKLLRKPMNRPWCVVAHPGGGILVGDSATREIYAFEGPGGEPKPLTDGHVGIPMALAVDADGKTIYVGDAEKRAVFAVPIDGGSPELIARVNARGLSFDGDGNLWAITPDAAAVQKIDVKAKTAETVVDGRPYQFPNGLVWAGDHGYVTDGYGKSIWKFTADGKTEKWFDGDTLGGPVGITANDTAVFVADPKKKQVFEINRESKEVKERL
ncbi:MAG: hypothetical protein HKN47_11740 [Pirellulaceae bacterium]|nr:hypothetical protein [Pirellulaceae bacterium]